METLPLRLPPGTDLRASLEDAVSSRSCGRIVRITAEMLLLLLADWSFTREPDPATGFAELVVQRTR